MNPGQAAAYDPIGSVLIFLGGGGGRPFLSEWAHKWPEPRILICVFTERNKHVLKKTRRLSSNLPSLTSLTVVQLSVGNRSQRRCQQRRSMLVVENDTFQAFDCVWYSCWEPPSTAVTYKPVFGRKSRENRVSEIASSRRWLGKVSACFMNICHASRCTQPNTAIISFPWKPGGAWKPSQRRH